MSDDRRAPRFRMITEALVTREGKLVANRVLDASAGGLRVRALEELRVGDAVRVSLRIPGSGAWIEGDGEICRRIEGRRSSDDGRAYGIRLRRMSPLGRRVLSSAACWYEEAAGGRGGRRDPDATAQRRELPDS